MSTITESHIKYLKRVALTWTDWILLKTVAIFSQKITIRVQKLELQVHSCTWAGEAISRESIITAAVVVPERVGATGIVVAVV